MRARTASHRRTILVTLVLGLGLGACGGGDTPDATPAAEDDAATGAAAGADAADDGAAPGCAVASPEEVEAATGYTVIGQEDFHGGCSWKLEPVEEDVIEAAISWQPWSVENFEAQREAAQAGMDVTEVDGVGDDAFIVSSHNGDHPIGEVWVRVGETAFRITNEFSTARMEGSLDVQQSLAAVVADALR